MGKTRNGGLNVPFRALSEISKSKRGFRENLLGMLQELDNGVLRGQGISAFSLRTQFLASSNQEENQKKQRKSYKKTLSCSYFPPTMIQILRFLSSLSTYNKIYGHLIINKDFQILYADKLARELLQGSLSSFCSNSLLNFVVEEDRQMFFKKCQQSIQKSNWFDYLTYSRSSLRKYDLCPQLQNPNNLDYFFRYMKSLSSQITPISIDFTGYQYNNESFWNRNLITVNKITKCFFFRICYSLKVPNLEGYIFSKDNIISKFQAITENKKLKKGITDQEKIKEKIHWNLIKEITKGNQEKNRKAQILPTSSKRKVQKINRRIRKINKNKKNFKPRSSLTQDKIAQNKDEMVQKANSLNKTIEQLKLPNKSVEQGSINIEKEVYQGEDAGLQFYSIQNQLAQQQMSSQENKKQQMLPEIEIQERLKGSFKIRTDLSFEIREDDDYISQFLA